MAALKSTPNDFRRGQCERQKDILLVRFVRRRAILNDPEKWSVPSHFVRSQLLEAMVGAAASNKIGVVVVKAGRGLGKTAAAKFVLKNSAGGIMFCHMKGPLYSSCPQNGYYWKGVARALGIPEECGEKWPYLLVSSVAAAASPAKARTGLKHWMGDFLEGLLSMCGGTEAETDVPSPPTIDGLDLTKVQNTPIIVFDDFNEVTGNDITFMKALFPIVFAKKVLLFVMVNDEATANKLVGLNGWRRITPLMDICRPYHRKMARP
jgi:hypothetical protein